MTTFDLENRPWTVTWSAPGCEPNDSLPPTISTTLFNRVTLRNTLTGLLRARGNWNRMTAELARQRAARFTPTELIAQLRESAGATRRAPGAGPLDPLVDNIVRGQNIARPLGWSWQSPTGRVVVALDHVLGTSFYGARKRLQGTRLTATDADWTHGHDEVRGSITDLLDSGDRTEHRPSRHRRCRTSTTRSSHQTD